MLPLSETETFDCKRRDVASTLQSALPWVLGDPLVNPNGHVIGIIVGNSGTGLKTVAYAIPINPALAVATRIAEGNS